MMSRRLAYPLLAVALLAAAARTYTRATPPISSHQVLIPAGVSAPSTPVNLRTFLPEAGASVHAATLAELPDGAIACAWFAGSREGGADVAVYLSHWQQGNWSKPLAIADRLQTQIDTARLTRKVGNPVLAVDASGRLHLWYVSTSVGGWSTSAVNHRVSADGGQSWSAARRLISAPFFNLSTLVRTLPLPLADGGFILPTTHELLTKHGEMTRVDSDGMVLYKQRLPANQPMDQPAMAPLPEAGGFLTLFRDPGEEPRHIGVASFSDAAGRWQTQPSLPVENPDASIALIRLHDGRLLLACNPMQGRSKLSLLLSEDGGRSWPEVLVVEDGPEKSNEYSYPTLLQDRTGMVHLVYTWNRQKIAHRLISPAALGISPGRRG